VLREVGGADAARFEAEVRTLARFVHPNLVRLLDAGELEGRPYLVMDLVECPTLAQRVSDGKLSTVETAKIGVASLQRSPQSSDGANRSRVHPTALPVSARRVLVWISVPT
jgi:serine/threonine protein kinase